MIKSKELIGPSCLTRARDDEPIFVLRANDEIAPLVVNFWATQYYKQKNRQPGGITAKQREKHIEAVRLADLMSRWRQKNAKALAESMTGHPVEAVESIVVDGEVKRIGDEVLSGCAVRASQQIERHLAQASSVPIPNSSEMAELMVKLGMQWLEANDPGKLRERQQASSRVCKLASELCNSIDAEAEDIGGQRPVTEILKELGPACDAYEGR